MFAIAFVHSFKEITTKFKMASYGGKRTRLYNVQETRKMRLTGEGEEESLMDNDNVGISSTEDEELDHKEERVYISKQE